MITEQPKKFGFADLEDESKRSPVAQFVSLSYCQVFIAEAKDLERPYPELATQELYKLFYCDR